jgi:hypothetical protein
MSRHHANGFWVSVSVHVGRMIIDPGQRVTMTDGADSVAPNECIRGILATRNVSSPYDRTSHIGKLGKALDELDRCGRTVVDMNRDWKVIYPLRVP